MKLQTNFDFLKDEFTLLGNLEGSAELLIYSDPVAALITLKQFGDVFSNVLFNEYGKGCRKRQCINSQQTSSHKDNNLDKFHTNE